MYAAVDDCGVGRSEGVRWAALHENVLVGFQPLPCGGNDEPSLVPGQAVGTVDGTVHNTTTALSIKWWRAWGKRN